MKRYMILALMDRRSMISAFFDEWSDAQNYLENLKNCVGVYIEVYERRPHGKGEDYTWEYTRIHRYNYGGMTKMNPNERTVVLRLKRNQVCRLLVMLAALAHSDDPESVRKHWIEIHESIKQDLADHDVKWRDRNAV